MNPAYLTLNLVTGGNVKKQISLVLATMVVILALPFMAVISMGSDVLQFLNAMPSAKAAETQGFYLGGPIPGDTYEWGNCTYWAYAMRLWAGHPVGQWWGNANTWDDNARLEGYIVDHTPAAGAVFQTDDGKWGHVAYVTKVDPDTGEWTISEMNAPHLNVVSTLTFAKESAVYYTFIHDKKGAAPWTSSTTSPPLLVTGN